jgi:hypothetical protein
MVSRRHKLASAACAGLVLGLTSVTSAGYSDLQRLLFRGLEQTGNFNYLSQPQNGPLYNYNQFRQRLEYNRGTQGYTYESYRFFGPDSFGNPNTLDLGPLKVELGLDPAVTTSNQPIGIHSRVGYSTRLLPEVFFDAQTGQQTFNQFSGISTFAPSPLHYTVTLNTGIQDFEWEGNALLDAHGRMNALGFYDFQMRFTNVGNSQASGTFIQDEQVTDFDLGPINVSGNIFFDGVAGFLQAAGLPGQATAPRIYSGAAQRDKRTDELLSRLRAGETLTDQEMKYLAKQMIEAAYRADPLGVMNNGLPSTVPGFEGLTLDMVATPTDSSAPTSDGAALVPEPGMLALLATAFGGAFAVRRWGRRHRIPCSLA